MPDETPLTDRERLAALDLARGEDPQFATRLREELEASRNAAALRRSREAAAGGRPQPPLPGELTKTDLVERLRAAAAASRAFGDDNL